MRLVLLLISFLFCINCTKTNSGNPENGIVLDGSILYFDHNGGVQNFSFTSKSSWTARIIAPYEDWFSIEPTQGEAGVNTITVVADVSESPNERLGKIKINSGLLNEEVQIVQKQKNFLRVGSTQYQFDYCGGDLLIEIESNIDIKYNIDDDCEWIKPQETKGLNSFILSLYVLRNDSIHPRSTTIQVQGEEISEIIEVTQNGCDPYITVFQKDYDLPSNGGEFIIEFNSNVDVNFEILDGGDWILPFNSPISSPSQLCFRVLKNESVRERYADILIHGEGIHEIVSVFQNGNDPYMIIPQTDYQIAAKGGIIEILIESNLDVEIDILNQVDWITVVRKDKRYDLHIQESNLLESRRAEIEFSSHEYDIRKNITVLQLQKDTIIFSKSQYSLGMEGGEIIVEVVSNVEYDIKISNNWIKQISTRSVQNDILMFEVEQNSESQNREGTIQFLSKNGLIAKKIAISQSCDNGSLEGLENGSTNEW